MSSSSHSIYSRFSEAGSAESGVYVNSPADGCRGDSAVLIRDMYKLADNK